MLIRYVAKDITYIVLTIYQIDTSRSDDISSNQINMELEKQYNQSIQYSSKYNKRGLS